MTEIEEKFFKVFGVDNCSNCDRKNSLECYYCDNKYPEITSNVLLKLIVLVTKYVNWIRKMKDIEDLKNATLEELIELDIFENFEVTKRYVRALFEEGAEDE